MCREGGLGWLVRASAVEVEEGEHAYRESLTGVCADDCRLPFRGRGERGARSGVVGGGLQHPFLWGGGLQHPF
jgi:hypothetical protein